MVEPVVERRARRALDPDWGCRSGNRQQRVSIQTRPMATRERPLGRARRLASLLERRMAGELLVARLGSGLSQTVVGAAAGMSRCQVARLERASTHPTIDQVARIATALGMDLSVRLYPAGDPIRDAGHAALLARLRRQLHPGLGWRTEVPLPSPGDQRAWDAVIRVGGVRVGVEAETAIRDAQAVLRKLNTKRRDGGVDEVLLLVSDTRANRAAMAVLRDLARDDLPHGAREVLAALRSGRAPAGSGVLLL